MKRIILLLSMMFLFVGISNAQTLPAGIKSYLDANYTASKGGAWAKAVGYCEGKKWLITGDFDGNQQIDYIVRFKVRKTARSTRLHLVAFLNTGGKYTPMKIFEDAYKDEFLRSAFSLLKQGTTVSLGQGEEGEGPTTKLKTDAVIQYICETDAAITYIYKNGKFKNISEK